MERPGMQATQVRMRWRELRSGMFKLEPEVVEEEIPRISTAARHLKKRAGLSRISDDRRWIHGTAKSIRLQVCRVACTKTVSHCSLRALRIAVTAAGLGVIHMVGFK
jgi:hypothetical protein